MNALKFRIRAFTLIEMVIVIVIMGIVFVIASNFLNIGFKGYQQGKALSSLSSKASVAMMRMNRDLENAIGFSSTQNSSLTFTTAGADSTSPYAPKVVTYALSGTNLTRTEGSGSAVVLCDEVSSLSFDYYNSSMGAAPNAATTRAVTITLNVQSSSNTVSLINTVYPRNL